MTRPNGKPAPVHLLQYGGEKPCVTFQIRPDGLGQPQASNQAGGGVLGCNGERCAVVLVHCCILYDINRRGISDPKASPQHCAVFKIGAAYP